MTPQKMINLSAKVETQNATSTSKAGPKLKLKASEVFFQRLGHKVYAFTVKNNEVYWTSLSLNEAKMT